MSTGAGTETVGTVEGLLWGAMQRLETGVSPAALVKELSGNTAHLQAVAAERDLPRATGTLDPAMMREAERNELARAVLRLAAKVEELGGDTKGMNPPGPMDGTGRPPEFVPLLRWAIDSLVERLPGR